MRYLKKIELFYCLLRNPLKNQRT